MTDNVQLCHRQRSKKSELLPRDVLDNGLVAGELREGVELAVLLLAVLDVSHAHKLVFGC